MATRRQKQLEQFEIIKERNSNTFDKCVSIEVNLGNGYWVSNMYHDDGYVDVEYRGENITKDRTFVFSHFPIYVFAEEIIDNILYEYEKAIENKEKEIDTFNDSQYCDKI